MIRKLLCLCLTLFFMMVAAPVRAGRISEADALQKAQAFLSQRKQSMAGHAPGHAVGELRLVERSARKAPRQGVKSQMNDYYVYNVEDNGGFVIVSGDDRTVAILGYADSGSFDPDDLPDGLRYMLDGYVEQMEWLDEVGEVNGAREVNEVQQTQQSAARHAIAPLIETRWNQGAPYNSLCPEIEGEKTVTGCVATCMAQLMYYYQLPTGQTTAIPGYTTTTKDKNGENYSLIVEGLTPTTFNWGAMKTIYTNNDTDPYDAVATLMEYCGVSLQMIYGLGSNGGSATYSECIPYALRAYFGYDGGVRNTYRKNYNYSEWVSLIYSELEASRPVALGGQSMGGGHSFICDGYDTDDYFHINWGWGGSSDGYFRLSVLQPWEQGIGGSSTLDGFSFSQNATIGIQRPVDGNKDYCLSLEALRLNSSGDVYSSSKTITRNALTDDFTGISLYFILCSYIAGTHDFDYAIQLVDADGDVVHTLYEDDSQSMPFNKNNYGDATRLANLSIPNTVADGIYYIKVVSRLSAVADPNDPDTPVIPNPWSECFDGDRYQLTAVISGNDLSISVPFPAVVYPTAATITVTGNLKQGYEQDVTASITAGSADYHGNILLCVNKKAVMGKIVDIKAANTVDVHFAYTPSTLGVDTLKLYPSRNGKNGSGPQIGSSTTVTITASDATNTQSLTIEPTITNLTSDGKLYGNAVRVTARVTNQSVTNSYAGHINCSLREYNSENAGIDDFESTYVTKPITIDAGSFTDVTFEYDGLTRGKFYRLRFSYLHGYEENGEMKTETVGLDPTELREMSEGYLVYNADGTYSIQPKPDAIDAGSALCLDLRGLASVPTFTASTNPNCIYLLPESTAKS